MWWKILSLSTKVKKYLSLNKGSVVTIVLLLIASVTSGYYWYDRTKRLGEQEKEIRAYVQKLQECISAREELTSEYNSIVERYGKLKQTLEQLRKLKNKNDEQVQQLVQRVIEIERQFSKFENVTLSGETCDEVVNHATEVVRDIFNEREASN